MSISEERSRMMSNQKVFLAPYKLYPLTTINSVNPLILQQVVEAMRNGEKIEPVKVMLFKDNYYILEGHYEMLAANILKRDIEVEVVNMKEINFWKDEENILYQLQAVGMSSLYDFEGIGGFSYEEYPLYYRKG